MLCHFSVQISSGSFRLYHVKCGENGIGQDRTGYSRLRQGRFGNEQFSSWYISLSVYVGLGQFNLGYARLNCVGNG